jgi:mono/diheme cytochrome c family protein
MSGRSARLLAAIALAAAPYAPAVAGDDNTVEAGRAIVEERCAACHAIGVSGESSHPQAPAFRTLSENYPVEDLAEALAEGIAVGHPDMPEFVATPEEIEAIIAHLRSIQNPAASD